MENFNLLSTIAREIIECETIDECLSSVKKLSFLYNDIIYNSSLNKLSGNADVLVKGGMALSPQHAADCTDDYMRTAVFIRGIHKAITKILSENPEKKVHIIYAGCGPFATLLLPLLPLFNSSSIEAILIDINKTSLDALQSLLCLSGLEDYNLTLIEADATTYTKPAGWDIDLLITETMHYALTSEPQVAVTKNFIPQLLTHSILIPQAIHINLAYTFYAKEPFLNDPENLPFISSLNAYAHRVTAGRLFTIDKNLSDILSGNYNIITPVYNKPDNYELCPDICIFTEVQVYENIVLSNAQSLITNPYCITSLNNLKGHSGFQLVYDFAETPKWHCLYY